VLRGLGCETRRRSAADDGSADRARWCWEKNGECGAGQRLWDQRGSGGGYARAAFERATGADEGDDAGEDRSGFDEAHSAGAMDSFQPLADLAWAAAMCGAKAGLCTVRDREALPELWESVR